MAKELTLERWDGIAGEERIAAAKALAKELPTGFRFRSVRRYKLGVSQHAVATYRKGDAVFALVPGGPATLGYDAQRPWEPTAEERDSWKSTGEEYGVRGGVRKYIARVTRRPKKVRLRPFLMETTGHLVGSEAEGDEEGLFSGSPTHAELMARLAREGFRLPTSDEWEYACGAGASTLFRWGDHVPCDLYPIEEGAAWDLHLRPNAFGIVFPSDTYKCELVAEPDLRRGGDGGGMTCGGAGFFVAWLILATAYFDEQACRRDPEEAIGEDCVDVIARRVLPLD